MRRTLLAAVAIAAAPAVPSAYAAALFGTGGGATGHGGINVSGTGFYATNSYTASCLYQSGTFGAKGKATTTAPNTSSTITVSCTLETAGGVYVASAAASGTPTAVGVGDNGPVPLMQRVISVCITAKATWTQGATVDSAEVTRCAYPGGRVWLNDIEIAIAPPVES